MSVAVATVLSAVRVLSVTDIARLPLPICWRYFVRCLPVCAAAGLIVDSAAARSSSHWSSVGLRRSLDSAE